MSEIVEYTKELLSNNEKLDCGTAFKIAKKLSKEVKEIGKIANKNGIRIDNCELRQFGHLDSKEGKTEALKVLEPFLGERRRISCKDAKEVAKRGFGLRNVRSNLKVYKIDVGHYKLGYFKEKKDKRFVVKAETWIENADGDLLSSKSKTELLELIAQMGNLLHASKLMGINYKRARTHLQTLQLNSQETLVSSRQGRSSRSGTKLTPKTLKLTQSYTILQRDVEEYTNKRFKELFFEEEDKRRKG